MGTLSGGYYDDILLYIIFVFLILTITLWMTLIWISPDPGSIDTRYQDFDTVMMLLLWDVFFKLLIDPLLFLCR